MSNYPMIRFNQFRSSTEEDELILFAAPAKVIGAWAGIPRKGWRIRMLYQRWVTPQREKELKDFWETASAPRRDAGQTYLLGPTAITIAIQGPLRVTDGQINLDYSVPVDLKESAVTNLGKLAQAVKPSILARLSETQRAVISDFEQDPHQEIPEVSHDYVFEFAFQLCQMAADPEWFVDENEVSTQELDELVVSLESLCRPAIVVDGQHRLTGAMNATPDIWLPVVAMPHCKWLDQIYQFIVINEKAQKVESTLLTDIFGSSLTRTEQTLLRDRLARAKAQVEQRIAAVIANRDDDSPFRNMVKVKLSGAPPSGTNPYITDITIRLLIDGGSGRNTLGWRSDDSFYEEYIKLTFPDRNDWDSWSSGQWRQYWFAFWSAVRDFYNQQGERLRPPVQLWNPIEQSNLTKGVTLRMFQRLFIEQACKRVRRARNAAKDLLEELGEELGQARVNKRLAQLSIPNTPEAFAADIKEWFLEKGVPLKVFYSPNVSWKASLDDPDGQLLLFRELEKAYEAVQNGDSYRLTKGSIFDFKDKDQQP